MRGRGRGRGRRGYEFVPPSRDRTHEQEYSAVPHVRCFIYPNTLHMILISMLQRAQLQAFSHMLAKVDWIMRHVHRSANTMLRDNVSDCMILELPLYLQGHEPRIYSDDRPLQFSLALNSTVR